MKTQNTPEFPFKRISRLRTYPADREQHQHFIHLETESSPYLLLRLGLSFRWKIPERACKRNACPFDIRDLMSCQSVRLWVPAGTERCSSGFSVFKCCSPTGHRLWKQSEQSSGSHGSSSPPDLWSLPLGGLQRFRGFTWCGLWVCACLAVVYSPDTQLEPNVLNVWQHHKRRFKLRGIDKGV